MPTRPRRVVSRNRDAERDGPDWAQADQHCPTRVRIQLSLLSFATASYEVWRGAAIKVVAANGQEAAELYEVVKAAALNWWAAKNAETKDEPKTSGRDRE